MKTEYNFIVINNLQYSNYEYVIYLNIYRDIIYKNIQI
jgi:hypothetical protein